MTEFEYRRGKTSHSKGFSDLALRHSELVSESDHRKTLGINQKEGVVASTMGQMPKQVQNDKVCRGRRAAFTLAEVLITLGIIGVVAAMTLPTLIGNYQKKQILTALKKNYSVLSQAVKSAQAEHGEDILSWKCANDCPYQSYYSNQSTVSVSNWFKYLGENVGFMEVADEGKISQYSGAELVCSSTANPEYRALKGTVINIGAGGYWSSGYGILKDGSCWFIGAGKVSNTSDDVLTVIIDVNGTKRPNRVGLDVFYFVIHRNGAITGYEASGVNTCDKRNTSIGRGCSSKVMDDGWDFAKDYPWK